MRQLAQVGWPKSAAPSQLGQVSWPKSAGPSRLAQSRLARSAPHTDQFVPFAADDLDFENGAVGDVFLAVDIDDAVDFRRVGFGAAGIGLRLVIPAIIDDV